MCAPATDATSPSTAPTISPAPPYAKISARSCKTEVVYGSDIDHAATASGKPYAQLPNAFRYRTEAVAGCTCNGKDQAGLSSIPVENDPTLRKGDIVAGADGLVVANPNGGKRAEANFTPLPELVRARLKNVPVVAKE